MSLLPGTRIGAYEVAAQIGVGGMGEVYRATDRKLKRQVAIKVLPAAVANDADRLARFRREAEVLASLNHPNIAQIYGLEDADGITALAMELVEGPTLADRIAQSAMPLDEALPIATQIIDALEAAHERGVVHRDLKPANLKVRPDGVAKVLDFGLAKLAESAAEHALDGGVSPSLMPTITSPALVTGAGMILGTAAYMSPEQARGRPVDQRADVWAFGCVLFEMLSGKRAFGDEDVSMTLSRVLQREPDFDALPATLPSRVLRVLRVCLQKDPNKRARDIGDVRLALEGAFESAPAASTNAPVVEAARVDPWRRTAALGGAIAVGAALAGSAVFYATRPVPPMVSRLALDEDATATLFSSALSQDVALSPDGQRVAFVGGDALLVRELADLQVRRIPVPGGPRGVHFSPDGQWLVFASAGESNLRKVAITGGPAVTVCKDCGEIRGASWGPNDVIVVGSSTKGLTRVSASGGEPVELTTPAANENHAWPDFLPNGKVLFSIVSTARLNESQLAVLDLDTGATKTVLRGGSRGSYVASGHLVFGASGTLRAVPFDLDTMEAKGSPLPVVNPITTLSNGAAQFSVARNGTLAYLVNGGGDRQNVMTWVTRGGREELLRAPARLYRYPRLSPDGTRVAVDIRDDEGQEDVWLWDLKLAALSRLTTDAGRDTHPQWTRDGTRLIFSSSRRGPRTLYRQAPDGSGQAEPLTEGPETQFALATAPGDKAILLRTGNAPSDLMTLAVGSGAKPMPLFASPFHETSGDLSPDGRWMVYDSEESGVREVYVRPFPDVQKGRWQVSSGGGSRPVWSKDGREIFFAKTDPLQGRLAMMSARVTGGPSWAADVPVKQFEGEFYFSDVPGTVGEGRNFDVTRDGQRFLMLKPDANRKRPQIFVVQNFTEDLKRLVPTR